MAALSVQDLVKSCGVQETLLDKEVTYIRFYEISRCLCEWKLAALKLNISQAEVDAIERENGKAELQRVNFLGVWRQKMAFKATYRVLVEALLSIGRAEDARGVCRALLDFNPIPPASPPTANTASPSAATPSGCATTSPSTAIIDVASSESSLPPPSSQVERTAEDIARMEKGFNELVEMAESSFIKNQVSVENIKKSIKRIPLTLKSILGDSFRDQALSFLESKRIEQLFIQLSYFWDYLNPGLLCFLVKEFASSDDSLKTSMEEYIRELNRFRKRVKVCDFIAACCTEASEHIVSFYSKIVTVMDPDVWKDCSLHDVEQYRKELCNRCCFPQSIFTKVRIQRSSIAIVFYFPRKSELNIEKLKLLFKRRNVVKVLLDNICIIDWTKECPSDETSWDQLPSLECTVRTDPMPTKSSDLNRVLFSLNRLKIVSRGRGESQLFPFHLDPIPTKSSNLNRALFSHRHLKMVSRGGGEGPSEVRSGRYNISEVLERLVKDQRSYAYTSPSSPTTPDSTATTEGRSDIKTSCLRVSLICPLSLQRMKYPSRGKACKHLQCFDAENYINAYEKQSLSRKKKLVGHYTRPSRVKNWHCPIILCDKIIYIPQLYVDKDMMKLVKESDATEVELSRNGSWVPVKKQQDVEVIDLTDD